jgi:nicotinic acid mononucleotide adenylyltransferase
MFDYKKSTVQMLGRWQPWHKGHTVLFKKALAKTGQVCIMVRLTEENDSNPFDPFTVTNNIKKCLTEEGYSFNKEYTIVVVPNIVDISYGRGVGYTFSEHNLGEEIHNISSTKIRKNMREKGELS